MKECRSNLSTSILTILQEQTYLCKTQLKNDKNINENENENENGNIISIDINTDSNKIIWELDDELNYIDEPIYI